MNPPRKPARSPLPHAPLEFAFPLLVERGEIGGAVLMTELPGEYALPFWRTYRFVISLAKGGDAVRLDVSELETWEQHVLEQVDAWEADVWSGVTAIVAAARDPAADREWIAFACLTLADWCARQSAPGAAICLAEAAALVAPANARYAYVAGRMYRERGNFREAEHWLDRSRRVAVWNADREAQTTALNSLGNLNQQLGRYDQAEELLLTALRTAKRARVRERIPFIYHDLLVVAVYTGDLARAAEYGREALHAYPPGHPNVPKLAHDIAWLWFQHGHFRRALKVFEVLLLHFTDPGPRLHVLGYAARAAAVTGDTDGFERYWTEAWQVMRADLGEGLRAAAALELGLGALDLSRWADADRALSAAVESAAASGENETLVKASAALERLGRRETANRVVPTAGARVLRSQDAFAGELVAVLTSGTSTSAGHRVGDESHDV